MKRLSGGLYRRARSRARRVYDAVRQDALLRARDFTLEAAPLPPQTKTVAAREAVVHPIYFSCDSHYRNLCFSMKSLSRLGSGLLGTVYLYEDEHDPFPPAKKETLLTFFPGRTIIRKTKYSMAGWTPQVILSELAAFDEVAAEAAPLDYVAKVDSDTLFVSDRVLRDVLESGAEAFGSEITTEFALERSGAKWFLGGCYFIRAAILPRVVRQPVRRLIHETAEMIGFASCPEDAAIFFLCRRLTDEIKLQNYMETFWEPYHVVTSHAAMAERVAQGWGRYSVYHRPIYAPDREAYWDYLIRHVQERGLL